MQKDALKIREFIAAEVEKRGLTHQELARRMGCSRSQVTLLLAGKRQWKEKWIDSLFAALGIDIKKNWNADGTLHRKLAKVLSRQDHDAEVLKTLLDRF